MTLLPQKRKGLLPPFLAAMMSVAIAANAAMDMPWRASLEPIKMRQAVPEAKASPLGEAECSNQLYLRREGKGLS